MPTNTRSRVLLAAACVLVAVGFVAGFLTKTVSIRSGGPTPVATTGSHKTAQHPRPITPAKPHQDTAHTEFQASVVGAVFGNRPKGFWNVARTGAPSDALPEKSRERVENIIALGYMGGAEPGANEHGVLKYDPQRAYPGINLVVSGHHTGAELMDMRGKSLHTWECPFSKAFPNQKLDPMEDLTRGAQIWSRAHVYPNGDIVAIYEGLGLVALDANSHVLWSRRGGYNHDITEGEDGLLYVLAREKHSVPGYFDGATILEDYVAVLNRSGKELRRVSILKAMLDSRYRHLVPENIGHGSAAIDVFHTNSVQPIPSKWVGHPPFLGKHLVLVSINQLNTIAVLDLDKDVAVWALTGMWTLQHCARILDNGNILVFDNFATTTSSAVTEVNPLTQQIVWQYQGSKAAPFFSRICGYNERLPNGNTLMVEAEQGRAIEVGRDHTIVWEYINPHRAGDKGQYIAFLFALERLDPTYFSPAFAQTWTDGGKKAPEPASAK